MKNACDELISRWVTAEKRKLKDMTIETSKTETHTQKKKEKRKRTEYPGTAGDNYSSAIYV